MPAFSVNQHNNLNVPGKHTIFGRVCRGMDIVKRLGSIQTDKNDRYHLHYIHSFTRVHQNTCVPLNQFHYSPAKTSCSIFFPILSILRIESYFITTMLVQAHPWSENPEDQCQRLKHAGPTCCHDLWSGCVWFLSLVMWCILEKWYQPLANLYFVVPF
jgi:hypothetical protein